MVSEAGGAGLAFGGEGRVIVMGGPTTILAERTLDVLAQRIPDTIGCRIAVEISLRKRSLETFRFPVAGNVLGQVLVHRRIKKKVVAHHKILLGDYVATIKDAG